jgi:hypothetical protein
MTVSYSQGFCQAYASLKEISIAKSATVLALVNGGASPDTITSNNTGTLNFLTLGFRSGDKIYVLNATDPADDIEAVECTNVVAGTITLPTGTFAAGQAAGAKLFIMASKGGSFVDLMQGGTLHWFKSTKPATADAVASSSDLVASFPDVKFGAVAWDSVNKYAYVDLLAALTTNGSADGTALWYRFVAYGEEAYAASTSAIRIDGSIGSSGDLVTANASVTNGAPLAVSSFKFRVPQVPA